MTGIGTMSKPELQVKGITRSFGGLTALMDVSFSLAAGETLGVIGPNGAGKTTLFNILSGFLKPEEGRIQYHGESILGLKPHQIVGSGIARTFQIVKPFKGMTVYENTMVAALSRRSRQARPKDLNSDQVTLQVLDRVALLSRKDDPVEGLPMGDLRRLELARALATYPDLILLDEPFSGLSLIEMEQQAGLIRELHAENRAFLIIEHKLKILMALVPRIIVLDFGCLIADGTPREIVENEKVIEAYLGRKGRKIVATEN